MGCGIGTRKVERRDFLKGAAGAVSYCALAPYVITTNALGNARILPASDRVALAHIGVGDRGGGILHHMLGLSDSQTVAVCDPFKNRREAAAAKVDESYSAARAAGSYRSCGAYNDFRELLARDDIDAVVVATPDHWHVSIAIAAAEAGKHMYVEKPLAVCISQHRPLREAITRAGVVFQYGTQQRAMGHMRFACELVRNGRVGKIHTIEVDAPSGSPGGSAAPLSPPDGFDYNLWLGPAPVVPYSDDRCKGVGRWHVYDYSVGFLGGWGAHPLDIVNWGGNYEDTSPVEYQGTGLIPSRGLYDTVMNWDIEARYADGVKLKFRTGTDSTRFVGPDGWVRVGRESLETEPKSLMRSVIRPEEIHLHRSEDHCQDFLNAVRTASPTSTSLESAIRSDAISLLSDIAVRTGRRIHWDPVKEEIVGDEGAARLAHRPMRSPWHL